MLLTVKEDVLTAPVDITLSGSGTVVPAQAGKADLFQQARFAVLWWLIMTPLGYLL